MNSVSLKIRAAGDLLLQALREPGSNINERLNATLNEFLTWPFRADPARIVDSEGRKATFETVIYSGSGKQSGTAITVNADAAACVIHAVRDLGAGEIRSGYENIAAVKRLKRTHAPETGSITRRPSELSSPWTLLYLSRKSRDWLSGRTPIASPQNGRT